jgi:hypothetical protein
LFVKADCVAVEVGKSLGAVLATFDNPINVLSKVIPVSVPLSVKLFNTVFPETFKLERNNVEPLTFNEELQVIIPLTVVLFKLLEPDIVNDELQVIIPLTVVSFKLLEPETFNILEQLTFPINSEAPKTDKLVSHLNIQLKSAPLAVSKDIKILLGLDIHNSIILGFTNLNEE